MVCTLSMFQLRYQPRPRAGAIARGAQEDLRAPGARQSTIDRAEAALRAQAHGPCRCQVQCVAGFRVQLGSMDHEYTATALTTRRVQSPDTLEIPWHQNTVHETLNIRCPNALALLSREAGPDLASEVLCRMNCWELAFDLVSGFNRSSVSGGCFSWALNSNSFIGCNHR